tara:strand:+ start:278 stop:688 length:411 start_codon:yes stop_codon:yes gene_type:complete
MQLKKNIKVGKIKINYLLTVLIFFLIFSENLESSVNLEGKFTAIKVLDKISSKNELINLQNGEDYKYKDLLIKSMKCKVSEFDDNPGIIAYIQVRDLTDKDKNNVFVFNGWMFSSSPSIKPFDHPVYDIWLVGCSN